MSEEWNVSGFSAAEYHAAKERAKHSAAEKVALEKLLDSMRKYPQREEQLLFELLAETLHAVKGGTSPRGSILDALQFERSVSQEKMAVFLNEIEEIIFASFRLLGGMNSATGDFLALELTVSVALAALRKWDQSRFDIVRADLQGKLTLSAEDRRLRILQKVQ